MSKKHFIALADAIKEHNRVLSTKDVPFTAEHLNTLADVLKRENSAFDRERWLGYIAGTNGPSGGAVRK